VEFLSPNGHNGSIRTDFDGLKRDRVLVLNDTIKTVSQAAEAAVSLGDAELMIGTALFLDQLLEELEDHILEVPHA
jgi:hypothetical protein